MFERMRKWFYATQNWKFSPILQIALDTTYWTIFNHITIWGSVLTYFVLDYFYNYVIGGPYVGSLTQAMREATFWCTTVITVIALMVPVMASRFYFIDVKPSLSDKVGRRKKFFLLISYTSIEFQIKMKHRLAQIKSRQSTDVLRTPSARRTRRSLRSGYAFAHQVKQNKKFIFCQKCFLKNEKKNNFFRRDSVDWLHPVK